jgi:hypothetical protein
MLYQLSYASVAQTEQKYHRGNQIASKFLPPCKPIAKPAVTVRSKPAQLPI